MKEKWIDVSKGIAIIGVVIQHVSGYLYTNNYFYHSVLFVVALFVMLGGYNTLSSYINRGTVIFKTRLIGIFLPYFLATMIYITYTEHFLNAENIVYHLLRFNASGTLYYVAVYMQLVFITPIIIGLLNWSEGTYKTVKFIFISIVIFLVCFLSNTYTNIFDIKTGGGNYICLAVVAVLVYGNGN